MKFLCVGCEELFRFEKAVAPEGGSHKLVFKCPSCATTMALMTNPGESAMFRSMGVKPGEPIISGSTQS